MAAKKRPELSDRQAVALVAIRRQIEQEGHPPTIRELAAAMGGINHGAAAAHLKALEAKGYITRKPSLARSIRVVE